MKTVSLESAIKWHAGRRFGLGAPTQTSHLNTLDFGAFLLVASLVTNKVFCIRKNCGTIEWERGFEPFLSPGILRVEERIVGVNSEEVFCIEAKTGKLCWSFTPDNSDFQKKREFVCSMPLLSGDRLFFGDQLGNFYCLSAQTGALLDKFQLKEGVFSGPPLAMDTSIFAVSTGKQFFEFDRALNLMFTQTLDMGSNHQPVAKENGVIVFSDHVFFDISLSDGKVTSYERARKILDLIHVQGHTFLLEEDRGDEGGQARKTSRYLVDFCGSLFGEMELKNFSSKLSYSSEKDAIVISGYKGVEILNYKTGEFLVRVPGPFPESPLILEDVMYVTGANHDLLAIDLSI